MPEFELAFEPVPSKGNTRFKDWVLRLDVPDEVAATIPYIELRKIKGMIHKKCPFDPMVGDYLNQFGHQWQVVRREGTMVDPFSKQRKYVPIAVCCYVQRLSVE